MLKLLKTIVVVFPSVASLLQMTNTPLKPFYLEPETCNGDNANEVLETFWDEEILMGWWSLQPLTPISYVSQK